MESLCSRMTRWHFCFVQKFLCSRILNGQQDGRLLHSSAELNFCQKAKGQAPPLWLIDSNKFWINSKGSTSIGWKKNNKVPHEYGKYIFFWKVEGYTSFIWLSKNLCQINSSFRYSEGSTSFDFFIKYKKAKCL